MYSSIEFKYKTILTEPIFSQSRIYKDIELEVYFLRKDLTIISISQLL